MGILSEFKKFIMRGNVVDLAVGLVIGAAFTKIVTAVVDGIFTPPIGWILAGVDFSQLGITLQSAEIKDGKAIPEVKLHIGRLIQSLLDFVIIGICLFLVVKGMNKLQKPAVEPPKETPEDVKLLIEIRDLLKAKA